MADKTYIAFDPRYYVDASIRAEPAFDLFEEDKKILAFRLGKLEEWIEQRKSILQDNLDHVDHDICTIDTEVDRATAAEPYDPKQVHDLEKTLVGLEMQKRLEQVNAFKDMWLVEKEILETVKQYQRLERMEQLTK
ncbi:MAG: hypothetical protein AAB393_05110 [Bacteroidota bacterium]